RVHEGPERETRRVRAKAFANRKSRSCQEIPRSQYFGRRVKTEFMTIPKQEPRWNPSERNQQEFGVMFMLLQFLVELATSLVELIFRADQSGHRLVSRQRVQSVAERPIHNLPACNSLCRAATSSPASIKTGIPV